MKDLHRNFTSHILDRKQTDKIQAIYAKALAFGDLIITIVPEGREQSVALTKLEEAMFWANAGISRGSNE